MDAAECYSALTHPWHAACTLASLTPRRMHNGYVEKIIAKEYTRPHCFMITRSQSIYPERYEYIVIFQSSDLC